jgi:hypothetical protein
MKESKENNMIVEHKIKKEKKQMEGSREGVYLIVEL